MKRLFLHIGHGKTGSSYLQSVLASNISNLEGAGIAYPLDTSSAKAAQEGRVTTGSGDLLADPNWIDAVAPNVAGNVLFSYEGLFAEVSREKETAVARWHMWRERLGCDRLSILLFTRDPIDHAASLFQQAAKTAKVTQRSLSEHFLRYKRPTQVLRVIKLLSADDTIDLTVRNYSQCKDSLAACTEDWLEIERGTLQTSNIPASVNRGLTFAELRLVLALSSHSKSASLKLANTFCDAMPNRKSDRMLPGKDVQAQLLEALRPDMDQVNALVSPDHQYKFTTLEQRPVENRLDMAQLSIALKFALTSPQNATKLLRAFAERDRFDFG